MKVLESKRPRAVEIVEAFLNGESKTEDQNANLLSDLRSIFPCSKLRESIE